MSYKAPSQPGRLVKLDLKLRADLARQREAFSRLSESKLADEMFSGRAWDEYCKAVRVLERRLKDVEGVIWSLRP